MKKIRDLISRPFVTVALFALALVLLGGSTVGGARAALTVESNYYNSDVQTLNIDAVLVENGADVAPDGKLLQNLVPKDEKFQFGKRYAEELAVRNTGDIDEYVRVSVYRYWLDEQGKKYPDMNSEWINLGYAEGNGWTVDTSVTGTYNKERIDFYYQSVLAPGQTSKPFLDNIYINKAAARKVTQTGDKVITTTYVYNNKSFCLEVHIDGVQTHNADKARTSAWGVYK